MSSLKQKVPTFLGILIILFSAVFAGLFVLTYSHWAIKKESYGFVNSESVIWNLYNNGDFGFSVEYPTDWIVKEDDFSGEVNFGQEKELEVDILNGMNEKVKIFRVGFTVKVYESKDSLPGNKNKLFLEDWINESFLPLKEGEDKERINFGIDSCEGILIKKYKSLGVTKLVSFVFSQNGGRIYEIRGEIPNLANFNFPTEYDYENVFELMLSTFRTKGNKTEIIIAASQR